MNWQCAEDVEVNANEILIDLLNDNQRRTHRVIEGLPEACLYWNADPGANTIAVTLWHMGRLFDVFFTQMVKGEPAEKECWFRRGWAGRTGYDPRGIGRDGWGSVNGYSQEEVRAIPRLSGEQLLGYLDEVYEEVRSYLGATPFEALEKPAAGFDGRYTKYQCIQMAMMDNVRHLGEIYTLKSMWER